MQEKRLTYMRKKMLERSIKLFACEIIHTPGLFLCPAKDLSESGQFKAKGKHDGDGGKGKVWNV
jgi:hypothetical protein